MLSAKRLAGLAVLVLSGLAMVACPPDPTAKPTSTPGFGGVVSLTEWAVGAPPPVSSGEVRFDVLNGGETVHQLAIYRGGSLSGDAIDGGELVARTGNILAGRTDAVQASLQPGSYWLVCPIPGHTALGMSAQLTAEAQ